MWAFGIFGYELAEKRAPYSKEPSIIAVMEAIASEDEVPQISTKWSDNYRDFVAKCLIKERTKRWSIKRLLRHDFLHNADQC